MKTKDLIAKKLRREKAQERKNRNIQAAKKKQVEENQDVGYVIPAGFEEDVLAEANRLPLGSFCGLLLS